MNGKEKLKGDCFEELTELYLKLHPRYATIINKVWNIRKEKCGKKQARATDTGVWMVELGKDLLRFFHELAGWPAIHVRPYEKSLSCRSQNLS